MFSGYTPPELDYKMEEYKGDSIEVLEHVAEWDFPIFELEAAAGGHILSQVNRGVVGGEEGGGERERERERERDLFSTYRWLTSSSWRQVYWRHSKSRSESSSTTSEH